MLQLRAEDSALSRMRIVRSPLWECVLSAHLLARSGASLPFPYRGWVREQRTRPRDERLIELQRWLAGFAEGELPSYLLPVPEGEDISTELDRLAATRPEQVAAAATGTAEHGYVSATTGGLTPLVEALDVHWKTAIAPRWRAMATALDEEVLVRGRTLANDGSDILLDSLHTRLSWHRPVLSIDGGRDGELTVNELRLVPVLFAQGQVVIAGVPGQARALGYQARGAAAVGEPVYRAAGLQGSGAADRLSVLVGPSRAAILRQLSCPATTSGLAAALGLAPSTVSQHLSALVSGDALQRRRVGATVLYELTSSGCNLLRHFDDELCRRTA